MWGGGPPAVKLFGSSCGISQLAPGTRSQPVITVVNLLRNEWMSVPTHIRFPSHRPPLQTGLWRRLAIRTTKCDFSRLSSHCSYAMSQAVECAECLTVLSPSPTDGAMSGTTPPPPRLSQWQPQGCGEATRRRWCPLFSATLPRPATTSCLCASRISLSL